MNNFQKNNFGNLGNLGNIANNLVNSFNSAAQSAKEFKPDPVKMAQATAMGKLMFWNAVRAVIALICGVLFLLGLMMTANGGVYTRWNFLFWVVLFAAITIRNIRKIIVETKKYKTMWGMLPVRQNTRQNGPQGAYRGPQYAQDTTTPIQTKPRYRPYTKPETGSKRKRLKNLNHKTILMPDGTRWEIID